MKRKGKFTYSKVKSTKWVFCDKNCGEEVEIDSEMESGICWRCTQKMSPPEKRLIKKDKTNGDENKIRRPRGWKLYKEFVDSEGNVFHKGIEQPKLKGTKKPTEIKPTKKKSAFQRERDRIEKQKRLAEKHKKKQEKISGKSKKRGRPKGSKNKR